MGIDIYNVTSAVGTTSTATAKTTKASDKTSESKSSDKASFSDKAVYEKSSDTGTKSSSKTKSNSAIVAQLKADAEARQNQLLEIVRKSIGDQAFTFAKATNLKSVFENMTVDQDTILQAQKYIAKNI